MSELSDLEKDWIADCEKCKSNQEMPLYGTVKAPLCCICKNADFHYGTWDKPECKVGYEDAELYFRCKKYDCPEFAHDDDPKNKSNHFFDENHQPIALSVNKLDFLNDIETLFYKEISLICIDDQIITGTLSNYTSELDNEPDGESIMIETRHGPVEIYTSEIKEVVLI